MSGRKDLPESVVEKTKLLASFLNNIAVAMVSLGFAAPLIATLYGATNSPPISEILLWGPLWLGGGLAMHYTAAGVLQDLDA